MVPHRARAVVAVSKLVSAEVDDLRGTVHAVRLGSRGRVGVLPAAQHIAIARADSALGRRGVVTVRARLKVDDAVRSEQVQANALVLGRPDDKARGRPIEGRGTDEWRHCGARNKQPSGGTLKVSVCDMS